MGIFSFFVNFYQFVVGVVVVAGRDIFGDDGIVGVFVQVGYFGFCVCLLMVVSYCYRIEFVYRVVVQ